MDSPQAGLVILGSGLGGYTLARELRKLDRHTPITLVTADGGEMYSKPMLSNAFGQNKSLEALVMKSADMMAAELGITVLTRRRVEAIDRSNRRLALSDQGAIGYDRLVLALGADPRPYAVPGSEEVPIATVNDLDGYRSWRAGLSQGARVLLIGAGLIGCEFANDMVSAGYRVTLVDPAGWPLGRLLPASLGDLLRQGLEEAGIAVHIGRSVARLTPAPAPAGGFIARLDDGTEIGFDQALSAIGLVPRTALAAAAGLAVDRGILVDRALRSSDPLIFALGDCAQTEAGPLPFVLPLMAQARALAATLRGTPTPLILAAMPVVVKTPCLPLAVCPPPPGAAGVWIVAGEGRDQKALFQTAEGRPIGFALSGAAVAERQSLAKEMPPLLN